MPSHIIHPIPPVLTPTPRILILGSFPSVKSEKAVFLRAPAESFLEALSAPAKGKRSIPPSRKRRNFCCGTTSSSGDTIHSCSIEGSSDSSIRDVVPNDLASILDHASIQAIYTNGGLSGKMYDRFCRKQTGIEAIKLPSTSPANAAWNLDRLTDAWKCINQILGKPGSETKALFPKAMHTGQNTLHLNKYHLHQNHIKYSPCRPMALLSDPLFRKIITNSAVSAKSSPFVLNVITFDTAYLS